MPPDPVDSGRRPHVEELAVRARSGEPSAVDQLLEAVRPGVLEQCGRFLPNRQDAEEACQDTLLAVARRITTFEGRSQFSTWLHAVTANCCLATYRTLKRRAAGVAPAAPGEHPDPRTTSVIAGSRIDLLDALEQIEAAHPQLVPPVVLRDVCGLEYAAIASELDVPLGTVRSRIHEGRSHLRRLLA